MSSRPTLQLHNTLTRIQEIFRPIDADRVRMYVCGPTVYDYAHIGNARPVVVFDVLFRLLRRVYGEDHVTYVRNITDIDDKIIERARESGERIESITRRTADAYVADMRALGALDPSVQPRATQHIPDMIAVIEKLIANGHAYVADGHVLFSVPSDPDYGRLSGRSRDEQIAGARVDVAPYKRDPADFVLWKPSAPQQPGWPSPWGRGRPGWHIECSAMSAAHLGAHFDIHGGGHDLIFPHHENEIAQSECAHGGVMAHTWMHNGFLEVNGAKMSKSLGNFFTVRELLEKWPGEAIRLLLLKTHYRAPLDFTEEGLRQAKGELDRFYTALRGVAGVTAATDVVPTAVIDALADDLNTPLAIARLHEEVRELNASGDATRKAQLKSILLQGGALLGLLGQEAEAWLKGGGDVSGDAAIEAAIAARIAARKAKNFAESDRIRDDLKAKGIILEDGPKGTSWRRA
jgi:cysteinyl-tRNA synthetase